MQANIITIPRGRVYSDSGSVTSSESIAASAAASAKAVRKRNTAAGKKKLPVLIQTTHKFKNVDPDGNDDIGNIIVGIFKENSKLRVENTMMQQRLKTYEMRYGAL